MVIPITPVGTGGSPVPAAGTKMVLDICQVSVNAAAETGESRLHESDVLKHEFASFFSDGFKSLLAERAKSKRWLSMEDITSYLGIKRDTAYKWIKRKKMPAHKGGRLWKFRQSEIDEWLQSEQGK